MSSTAVRKSEAAILSHRAVNKIFAHHAAAGKRAHDDRVSGRTWVTEKGAGAHGGDRAAPSGNGASRTHYTAEQLDQIAASGGTVDANGNIIAISDTGAVGGGGSKSCFLVNLAKIGHKYERTPDAVAAAQNCPMTHREAVEEYQRAVHIIRHERTVPKRRILDRYLQLTMAQADTRLEVPSRSSVRRRVRDHEGWVLQNTERQQLARGRPAMSRIMEGEYYTSNAPTRNFVRDFGAINRRHVRAASQANRVANANAALQTLPTNSAAPYPRDKTNATRACATEPTMTTRPPTTSSRQRAHSAGSAAGSAGGARDVGARAVDDGRRTAGRTVIPAHRPMTAPRLDASATFPVGPVPSH